MREDEIIAIFDLKEENESVHTLAAPVQGISFADQALLDLKKNLAQPKPSYADPSFIPSTSVKVESLFSISGYFFNSRRLGTEPSRIEQQLFLKFNKHIWNVQLVNQVVVDADNEV